MNVQAFDRQDFDLFSFDEVKPRFDDMLCREIKDGNGFRELLADYNRLLKWIHECGGRLRLAADREMTTENTEKSLAFTRNVITAMASTDNQLKNRIFELGKEYDPGIPGYAAYRNRLSLQLKLFRQENVELQKQITEATSRFFKGMSAISRSFKGEQLSYSMLSDRLKQSNSADRELIYSLLADADDEMAEVSDGVLDQILELRQQQARHAGYTHCLEYLCHVIGRSDYSLTEVKAMHLSVREKLAPLYAALLDYKAKKDGRTETRPWDMASEFFNWSEEGLMKDKDFHKVVTEILDEVAHQPLNEYYQWMKTEDLLDLDSRMGKRSGAYCMSMYHSGKPFILSNIGHPIDRYTTFFHELGHAWHFGRSRHLGFMEVCYAPMEVNELASQALELICLGKFSKALTGSHEAENKFKMLIYVNTLKTVIYSSLMDEFCHWLYENPGHTHSERSAQWTYLNSLYYPSVNYNIEGKLRNSYRAVGHFYFDSRPLYHIEYGISQLGALQVYQEYQKYPAKALQAYDHALSLGYTATIPEIYRAAGAEFDFSENGIAKTATIAQQAIDSLIH